MGIHVYAGSATLTNNQIASGVLAGAGMLALTGVYFASHQVAEGSTGEKILAHMSYLHLWLEALGGKLMPRYLLFHTSVAVLFLFLTGRKS